MKCNHEYAEIYTGIASTVFECIHCEHQIDNDTYYKLLDMQSRLRLLAEAVLEAHQDKRYVAINKDLPVEISTRQNEDDYTVYVYKCQCEACKVAREVLSE